MEIKGRVEVITPVKNGVSAGGKEWSKATVGINTEEGQYPAKIAIDFLNKSDELAKFKVGDVIKVIYNQEYKEHNGSLYNSINAWKVEVIEAGNYTSGLKQPAQQPQQVTPPTEENDGLPF
jgi:hypothetical protein